VAESGLTTTRALLRTDWGALMGGLESARTPKIGLLSLDLDTGRGGSLAMTAEARDHAAMLAYVETLEALPMLDKVALDSHAERERDGERAVRFSLKARWHLSGRAP
jgi:Tfp pilus assembly protein PilN